MPSASAAIPPEASLRSAGQLPSPLQIASTLACASATTGCTSGSASVSAFRMTTERWQLALTRDLVHLAYTRSRGRLEPEVDGVIGVGNRQVRPPGETQRHLQNLSLASFLQLEVDDLMSEVPPADRGLVRTSSRVSDAHEVAAVLLVTVELETELDESFLRARYGLEVAVRPRRVRHGDIEPARIAGCHHRDGRGQEDPSHR